MTTTSRSRQLQPGDLVVVDWNRNNKITEHRILERCDDGTEGPSQSGVMFRVTPALRNTTERHWIDADWFRPLDQSGLREARG